MADDPYHIKNMEDYLNFYLLNNKLINNGPMIIFIVQNWRKFILKYSNVVP